MDEKEAILAGSLGEYSSSLSAEGQSWRRRLKQALVLTVILAVVVFYRHSCGSTTRDLGFPSTSKYKNVCPAQEAIGPKSHPEITKKNVENLFKSYDYRALSVKRLSGATQIPTEDFDDMGPVGEDARWDVFYDLQKYFRDTFPLL